MTPAEILLDTIRAGAILIGLVLFLVGLLELAKRQKPNHIFERPRIPPGTLLTYLIILIVCIGAAYLIFAGFENLSNGGHHDLLRNSL